MSGDARAWLERIHALEFPEPVIHVAIEPKTKSDQEKLGKALKSLSDEDPTFRVSTDPETGETVIAGMGELHLDVYIERMRREYRAQVTVGAPNVSYREAPTAEANFNYRHKKQTGGSGQFAHVIGRLIPLEADAESGYEFDELTQAWWIFIDNGYDVEILERK